MRRWREISDFASQKFRLTLAPDPEARFISGSRRLRGFINVIDLNDKYCLISVLLMLWVGV